MKYLLITFIVCTLAVSSYSQDHIKFNGATFGLPLIEFIKGFQGESSKTYIPSPKGFNPNLCNCDGYIIVLNAYRWDCLIFSSIITKTVFRTVSVQSFTDLENNLMLFVKALEEKYGGGIQEKQENLGEISHSYRDYREMLALYYYVKGANNKIIGEIRIAAAPSSKDGKSGCIELSYTDYKACDLATKEYNSLMREAL